MVVECIGRAGTEVHLPDLRFIEVEVLLRNLKSLQLNLEALHLRAEVSHLRVDGLSVWPRTQVYRRNAASQILVFNLFEASLVHHHC